MRGYPLLIALSSIVCLAAPATAEPTAKLAGRVTTAGGAPVAGASVMVNRAWPIKGLAYYCPGCYRDCSKSTKTNAQGDWSITGLDSTLKFELLVVAKGYSPERTPVFNPSVSPAASVELKPRDISAMPPEHVVRGRVLDVDGKPIEGAVVSPDMVYTKESGCGGMCEGLDQLAVTDEEGRFALTYAKPCVSMDLSVSARNASHTCFLQRVSGGKEHELRIAEGATIGGRLVRDGKPVPDVEISLVADQRGYPRPCYDRQNIATGKDGGFLFTNVLPGQKYVITASTEQLRSGCVAPLLVDGATEGGEIDIGELVVIKGVRVSGRLLPPKGGKLPAQVKLSLSSQTGWDGVTLDIGPDGRFDFPEVAPGEYSVSLHAQGIYVSFRNASADKMNGGSLIGRVDADIAALEIETTSEQPKRVQWGDPEELPEIGGIESRNRQRPKWR